MNVGEAHSLAPCGGKTPLHCAIEAGIPNPGIVKLLISHGADVKAVDCHGKTPIQYTNINPLKSPAYPVTISSTYFHL